MSNVILIAYVRYEVVAVVVTVGSDTTPSHNTTYHLATIGIWLRSDGVSYISNSHSST